MAVNRGWTDKLLKSLVIWRAEPHLDDFDDDDRDEGDAGDHGRLPGELPRPDEPRIWKKLKITDNSTFKFPSIQNKLLLILTNCYMTEQNSLPKNSV